MADRKGVTTSRDRDCGDHPAARAWRSSGGRSAVDRVETLRRGRHCRVYRLVDDDAPGRSVIAKWQDRPFGFEKRVQQEILPSVGLPSLEVYGEWALPAESCFWIFFEDAGDDCFSPSGDDKTLVARWLAALHGWVWSSVDVETLPDRGPAGYLEHLRSALHAMASVVAQPRLGETSRASLGDLLRQLEQLGRQWDRVESWCLTAPRTLVHGDLADKNARLRPGIASKELLVFDWEMAGIGVPCVDLAQGTFGSLSPDLEVYRNSAPAWGPRALGDLRRLAAIGKVFRLLAALDWEAQSLPYDWCDGRELWPFPAWLREARADAGL
jgi:hypothetical protein